MTSYVESRGSSLKSAHAKTREADTLMHELAHLIIGHKPARLDITDDGLTILSSYDKQHEDEANWLPSVVNYRTFLAPPDPRVRMLLEGVFRLQQCA